jgi:hypothetical protein
VAEVWKNWEAIKRAEKHGTRHARASVLDWNSPAFAGLVTSGKSS